MKRIKILARNNWQSKVEKKGFLYHTLQDVPYWDETACYEFSSKEINILEEAINKLHEMFITAAQYVIDKKLYHHFDIPEYIIPIIEKAWNESDKNFFSLYGRFDFVFDGINPPKLLEFNADTPTSLFEASVIQWYWLQDYNSKFDQFNSIDEKLIECWKHIHEQYRSSIYHFACLKDPGNETPEMQLREDIANTAYILDTASRVNGLNYHFMDISDIGWDNEFIDEEGKIIETIFKLYPWEWLVNEEYGKHLPDSNVKWIEPIWKMLWSNKAILPILWELFPDSPYLLPSYFEPMNNSYVKKPKLSREGANISIIRNNITEIEGSDEGYGEEGFIYQDIATIPCFDGTYYPIIGSWIIGGESAGIGIRESNSMITDNKSRFIPHYFE